MAMPTLFELAQAGAHYGHHRSLTFPKAKNFVYMTKNNVSLINLEETLKGLEAANALLNDYRAKNKPVLFVGTKRSIREIVKNAAEAAGAHYVVERWYGGFLTNFPNFLSQIKKIGDMEEFLKSEKAARLDKKERARHQARYDHAMRFLGGVATLKSMPELIVVGSATEDKIAIAEAQRMNIPVVAITDTDVNPTEIDYPIPANDDAPKAVELILQSLVAQNGAPKRESTSEAAAEKPKKTVSKKTTAKKTTKSKK
jgi:small subunit ribosomal protein S2